MSVDLEKWRYLGSQRPETNWKPVTEGVNPSLSTAVETFLLVFKNFSHNRPDYLMRSKLVLRPIYALGSINADIESRELWIKPARDPREITVEYPRALLLDGTIFRTFECRRWNRYRNGMNYDGYWEFDMYESLQQRYLDDLPTPPDPPPPPPPETEWQFRY